MTLGYAAEIRANAHVKKGIVDRGDRGEPNVRSVLPELPILGAPVDPGQHFGLASELGFQRRDPLPWRKTGSGAADFARRLDPNQQALDEVFGRDGAG